MLKYLWLSGLVIVLDQVSKWIISSSFSLYETLAVMPYFNLTLAHNTGAAFSFLAQAGGWQRWFFIGLTTVISVALFIWLKKLSTQAKLEAISISLILGGAIGNVIDRIYFGYVVDFLDFYYGTAHFAAFNIADAAICVGAGLLIIDSFISKPESDQKTA
ncbi:MAG: signal peptidase II [Methylophagaceae bacterium]